MATTQTETTYEPIAQSVGEARRWASEWLSSHRVQAVVIDDVVLCLSEVLTNAVKHNGSPQPIQVRLAVLSDVVWFSVRDNNNVEPSRRTPRDDDENGRGSLVLDAVALAWGTLPLQRGKSVWCEVGLKESRSHES